MASLGAHALMVALLVTSGIWAAPSFHESPRVHSVLVTDLTFVLPPAPDSLRGGGGGGDSDALQASNGNPPRFAREQIAPPAIVVRSEQPKLPAEPTVVGPPALSFPQTKQIGDPFSHTSGPPSNGTGTDGGVGTGNRGGVGPGTGPGVGDGWGGGIGGGPYVVGRGVTAPQLIYDPEPEYSEEARKEKYQGVVLLQVIVGEDGGARDVRIVRSLGLEYCVYEACDGFAAFEMLERMKEGTGNLLDPTSSEAQQPAYAANEFRSRKPEYMVLSLTCTHLGCSPAFRPEVAPEDIGPDWKGGFLCPCHGSRFDLAGRVMKNVPAPLNLVVPPYRFANDDLIVVGEDEETHG